MQPASPDFAQLKSNMKASWVAGDFGKIANFTVKAAEEFIARTPIQPGTRVLDVACGTGNTAIPAARAGGLVTGVDIAPNLLEQARKRAAEERLEIRFQEGDAEELPVGDHEFDVVLTMFGAMFAPRPERVAAELIRVCKPGGIIAMANWTPEGFIGQLFRVIGAYVPPPPGTKSPALWGSEPRIVELFGPAAIDIRCVRRDFNFRYRSAAHWIEVFRNFYGPTHKAYAALDPARQADLTEDITALLERLNIAGSSSLVVPAEYLEVVITRK